MKKLLLLVPVIMLAVFTSCNATDKGGKGIEFFETGSWKAVLAKAKAEHKLIFLDIYASWCGPCKLLKKNTFTDKEVGSYFNERFISTSFDGEKGDGVMLANQFKIEGYPTLIILDENGNVLNGSIGYLEPKDLIDFAKQSTVKGGRH